jgi:hypothetical protein
MHILRSYRSVFLFFSCVEKKCAFITNRSFTAFIEFGFTCERFGLKFLFERHHFCNYIYIMKSQWSESNSYWTINTSMKFDSCSSIANHKSTNSINTKSANDDKKLNEFFKKIEIHDDLLNECLSVIHQLKLNKNVGIENFVVL